jgi:hypothetical protein
VAELTDIREIVRRRYANAAQAAASMPTIASGIRVELLRL